MKDLDIIRQECEYFHGLQPGVSLLKTRISGIVECRQQAMYFAIKYTKHTLAEIGSFMGGKDHSTVLHSRKVVKNMCQTNRDYEYRLLRLESILIDKQHLKPPLMVSAHFIMSGDIEFWKQFKSDTEAFGFYEKNSSNIISCEITIKSNHVRKHEFTATNEPIELNLKQ